MAWEDTYRLSGDPQQFAQLRLNVPPQLPETRGKWNLARIPDYFREEVIRCIAINSPTLDYFKNTHRQNWHRQVERWPKGFRVLTDYGEGIYQVKDPRLDMRDLSGQSARYDYYDVFGNRTTPTNEFDWEQTKWRSVAWYPGIIAFRVQFPQFDRVLVGREEWNRHVDRVVEEEIKGKSQALNIRLWDGGLTAYGLDYDPQFASANASPMAWGTIPYYINGIAWKRISAGGKLYLTPITQSDLDVLNTFLNDTSITQTDYEAFRDLINTFSFFYTSLDGQTASTTSENMRQQTVATVNRGIVTAPTNYSGANSFQSIVGAGFASADYHGRLRLLREHIAKNMWWSVPNEFTIWLRGSQRVEMSQIIYPIGVDSSSNPVYPRYNITDRVFDTTIGSFPFSPADLERLYVATFYNYGKNSPKAGFCRPEVIIKMNQLAMTDRVFHQNRRTFGPADFGIDAVFRDVAMLSDLAVPQGVLYMLGSDDVHFALTEDTFQTEMRPTNNFIDYMDGWTAYKVMMSDMRRHGIYWGFQV